MPKVSVVMPVYNGSKHIREAIESVLAQSFTDWDFWAINEYGSNDGSDQIIQEYAQRDNRFHLVQNEERLGLADSLNKGFELAQGEYYARLDADDLAHSERFARQVAYLDEHPNVGICGTYQHHFGKDTDWVHRPPVSAEECRTRLLFNCDLCHSTLMLRRSVVQKYKLFYDKTYLAEDFELWGRAIFVTDIANIPEILGEYRWDGDNITVSKERALDEESGRLVGRNLKLALNMELTEEECELFRGWHNPFDKYSGEEKEKKLGQLERLLREIYTRNRKHRTFDESCLLSGLACKWRWAKYNAPWDAHYDIREIDEVFCENYKPGFWTRYKAFRARYTSFGTRLRRMFAILLRPLAHPFRTRLEQIASGQADRICQYIGETSRCSISKMEQRLDEMEKLLDARERELLEKVDKTVEGWTWDRYQRAEQELLPRIDKIVEGWTWDRYQRGFQERESIAWNLSYEINPKRMADSIGRSQVYDYRFYQNNRFGSVNSAMRILRVVLEWFPHESCVDFGCGSGTWLWVASALGVQTVYGIDGDYVPKGMLMIDESVFHNADLEKPVTLPRRFSFAMSMEVAEHLAPEAAEDFVSSLCGASDVVLFSAAHPGQGGDHHVNEQPAEYWMEKFAARGYLSIQIKQIFQSDMKIEPWYRENMVLFAHEDKYSDIAAAVADWTNGRV